MDGARPDQDPERRVRLLEDARTLIARGRTDAAWTAVAEVAALGRAADDVTTLADAALVLRRPDDPALRARVHALAVEASARWDASDPLVTARLAEQVEATRNPFHDDRDSHDPDGTEEPGDPEAAYLSLQARAGRLQHVRHVQERLRIADEAVALGRRTGDAEYACWGRFGRMDAYLQLGRRVEATDELEAVEPLVERLGSAWSSRLLLVRGSQAALEGRFSAARTYVARAVATDDAGGAGYFAVVHASDLARLTGEGADDAVHAVARAVEGLPYLAKGWLCETTLAAGHRAEAADLWRALVPHLRRMPEEAPEWLIGTVGFAQACVELGDAETAALLHERLLPYAGLHAIAYASTPYYGPVSYALGRLARLLGRPEQAGEHLAQSLTEAAGVQALPYVALSHDELARLHGDRTRAGREHATAALALAHRLGMGPLGQSLSERLSPHDGRVTGLTRRELEVARLVSEGLTNRAIAARLVLSERTVENHVARILHKHGLPSRTALAVWLGGR